MFEAPNKEHNEQVAAQKVLESLEQEFINLDIDVLKGIVDEKYAAEKDIDALGEAPTRNELITSDEYDALAKKVLESRKED